MRFTQKEKALLKKYKFFTFEGDKPIPTPEFLETVRLFNEAVRKKRDIEKLTYIQ